MSYENIFFDGQIENLSNFVAESCQSADRISIDISKATPTFIQQCEDYGFIKLNESLMALNLRRAVRAMVFNPDNELLLIHAVGGPTKDKRRKIDDPFWFTIGGQIEKNESLEHALARELQEEAGVREYQSQLVAYGEKVILWHDFPTRVIEKLFAVHVSKALLHENNLTEEESKFFKAFHWWKVEDLLHTHEIIYPQCLPTLAKRYLANKDNWLVESIDLS